MTIAQDIAISNLTSLNKNILTELNSSLVSATSSNIPDTIVKRDGSGGFDAGAINATSLTTPTIYGGTADNSKLDLRPTSSGSPASDSLIRMYTNNQLRFILSNDGEASFGVNVVSPWFALSGSNSGVISMLGQTNAGTYNFNFPITAGSANQVLTSQGGGATAMTWTDATDANTASAIVKRDVSGNFSAGTITANLTGTASVATLANNVATSNESSDTSCFLAFFTGSGTQVQPAKVNPSLGYNSTTNAITATSFIGALSGNATTATALATGRTISITGDLVYTSPSFDGSGNVTATGTLATVNSNVGSFGSATQVGTFTVNGKGLITAASNTTITPAVDSITGLGTGIDTALGVNVGSAGAPVLFNGAGGTPSSIVLTNATGTAASLTAGTSTVANTVSTADEASDTTCFPLFVTASGTQSLQPKNNTNFRYNASTNQLTANLISVDNGGAALSGTNNILSFPNSAARGNYINLGTGGRNIGVLSGGPAFFSFNLDYDSTASSYKYNSTNTAAAIELSSSGVFLKYAVSGTAGNNITLSTGLSISAAGAASIPNGDLSVSRSNSGGTVLQTISNTSNTASSNAELLLSVAGSSANDPFTNYNISGVQDWSQGADNSDSDAYIIAASSALGTTNVMRISTAGEVTLPLQPSFLAINSTTDTDVTGDGTLYTLICDTEVADRGADYNNATGVFTAPVTGLYTLQVTALVKGLGVANTLGFLEIVTSNRTYYFECNPGAIRTAGNETSMTLCQPCCDMDAGDTATFAVQVNSGTKVVDIHGDSAAPQTFVSGCLNV